MRLSNVMNHNESRPHLTWWICNEEIESLTLVSSHQTIFHQSFNHLFHFHREIQSQWKQIIRYKNLFNNCKSFEIACMYNLWRLAQLLKQHPNPVFAPHLEQRFKIIHAFLLLEHQVKEIYTHPEKMGRVWSVLRIWFNDVQLGVRGIYVNSSFVDEGALFKNKSLTRSWIYPPFDSFQLRSQ